MTDPEPTLHTSELTCELLSARHLLAINIPPRQRRRDRPIAIDRTPVKIRGEDLHPVWWRGRQWAVTAYGIERLDGAYTIEADRLTELMESGGWPEHMGGKRWVDTEEFATAWLVALVLHGAQVTAKDVRQAVARAVVHSEATP